jgi:hypothetical protein
LAQKKFRNIGNHATKKGHESNEGWFGKANKGDENNNESKGKQESFGKGKAKPPHKLNKTNLDKLGKMSLDDKIRQAATEGETPEEQAIVLKGILCKDEHSKLWGRYKTHVGKIQMRKKKLTICQKKTKASRQPSG